jgi:hypothetical protein
VSKSRSLIGNLFLLVVVLTATLFTAEIVWKIAVASGDIGRQFDETLRFVNPPNTEWTIKQKEYETHIRTNSLGFRGPEMPPVPKSDDELRVLFLGDSFVVAKQVEEEERFVEKTEVALAEALDRPVVTRGLGIGGANPALHLLYYREIGKDFDPDVVVQVLFPENDLMPLEGPYSFREDGDALVVENVWVEPQPACNWKCGLLKKSSILRLTYQALRGKNDDASASELLGDYYWYTTEGQMALATQKRWQVLSALVTQLHDEVVWDGGTFIVMLMPSALEMQKTWQEEYLSNDQPYLWDFWQIDQLLSRAKYVLEEEGMIVLDLRTAFAEAVTDEEPLYYKTDPHLSVRGHDVVVEALSGTVEDLL